MLKFTWLGGFVQASIKQISPKKYLLILLFVIITKRTIFTVK